MINARTSFSALDLCITIYCSNDGPYLQQHPLTPHTRSTCQLLHHPLVFPTFWSLSLSPGLQRSLILFLRSAFGIIYVLPYVKVITTLLNFDSRWPSCPFPFYVPYTLRFVSGRRGDKAIEYSACSPWSPNNHLPCPCPLFRLQAAPFLFFCIYYFALLPATLPVFVWVAMRPSPCT